MQAVCSADQSVLACTVCGHFPVNVVETQCSPQCSPLYCWECVARLERCVMCAGKIDVEKLRPLPFIHQRLSMLNVRCGNPGCSAIYKTGERDKHERECSFSLVTCSISHACGSFLRMKIVEHEAECPGRILMCPEGCGDALTASVMGQHVAACASKLIACGVGKCDVQARRCDLAAHQQMCVHRERACMLLNMGCVFKGTVEQMSMHMKDDTSHWQLVATEMTKLQNRIDMLSAQSPIATEVVPEANLASFRVLDERAKRELKIFVVLIGLFAALLWVASQTGCGASVFIIAALSALLQHSMRPPVPRPNHCMNLKGRKLCKIFCVAMLVFMSIVWMQTKRSLLWVGFLCAVAMFVVRWINKSKSMTTPLLLNRHSAPSCFTSLPAAAVAPQVCSSPQWHDGSISTPSSTGTCRGPTSKKIS